MSSPVTEWGWEWEWEWGVSLLARAVIFRNDHSNQNTSKLEPQRLHSVPVDPGPELTRVHCLALQKTSTKNKNKILIKTKLTS